MTTTNANAIDRLGELETVALPDRWRTFFQHWKLIRLLRTRGAFGQLLLCESLDDLSVQLLVKTAREPKDELKHEALVNDDIRDLVSACCPHFMHVDYHCYMPWSYLDSDYGRPCLQRYTLFFRAAPSRLTIETMVRRFWYDTPLIMSQVSLMLAALQLAQQLADFTHYDAHLNNVLEQKTDARWMLYRLPVSYSPDPVVVLLPTFGHYPFFIDYGRSHSVSVGKNTTSIHYLMQHQKCGIQTAVFDGAYDVHQLMLCLAHSMQPDSDSEEDNESESEESDDSEESEEKSNEQSDSSSNSSLSSRSSHRSFSVSSIGSKSIDSDPFDENDFEEEEENENNDEENSDNDSNGITNHRVDSGEILLDETIRMFHSLPINSKSGRRLYEHDLCEALFIVIHNRVPKPSSTSTGCGTNGGL